MACGKHKSAQDRTQHLNMLLSPVRVAGWLLVAGIILLPVLPGQDRPHSGAPGHFEHLVAYLLASIVPALGYPSHPARIALLSLTAGSKETLRARLLSVSRAFS